MRGGGRSATGRLDAPTSAPVRADTHRTASSGRTANGSILIRPMRSLLNRVVWLSSAVGLERGARLIAVATVPLLLIGRNDPRWNLLFAALAVYVLLTALARRAPLLRAADILAAASLIVLTNGEVAPFVLFLVVAVAGPAARGGIPAGLAAGGVLSAVLVVTLAVTGALPELGLGGILPAALLLPLVGVTTASAVQILEEHEDQNRRVLKEANRLLSSLRTIADELPGGLDATTIAAATIAELRAIRGTEAAVVYVEHAGVLQPAGSGDVDAGRLGPLRVDEVRRLAGRRAEDQRLHASSELPAALRSACERQRWWEVISLGGGDDPAGALLVGFDDPERARDARSRLASIAADAALALENARLFDGTFVRATDSARRQVAADLHDGVAQSLAHLRMELELMSIAAAEPDDGGEIGRLARVAASALEDLRITINGLRRAADSDLPALLERHLQNVQPSDGPQIVYETSGTARLDAATTEDVLRIAQEAVSNALRHAEASTITVTLELDQTAVLLAVEDDGAGLGGSKHAGGGGIGLRSMRERAQRLGGELEVRSRVGGGTVVSLRCPIADFGTGHQHHAVAL